MTMEAREDGHQNSVMQCRRERGVEEKGEEIREREKERERERELPFATW